MKKITLFILVLLGFIFILSILPIGMGSTGIRPKTQDCLGITIDRNIIHKILPSGRIYFLSFAYYVSKDTMGDLDGNYCLGKDIWYGE